MIYEIKTVDGVKTKVPLTGNGYGLPLGTWISYEGTCPDGFIESEQTFNTTTYASLYAMLGTNKVPARFDPSRLGDYEAITISSDANNPAVMPYDGFFTFLMPMGTVGILNINEVAIFQDLKRDGSWAVSSSVTVPFKKGDNLYYSRLDTAPLVSKVAYYKRHLAIKATPAYVEPDTVSDMVNTLRTQDSYSTSEVNTGKKWIDGKPIYRKAYNGTVANGTVVVTNVDTLVDSGGSFFGGSVWSFFPYPLAAGNMCMPYVNNGKLILESAFSGEGRLWFEYTKTSD